MTQLLSSSNCLPNFSRFKKCAVNFAIIVFPIPQEDLSNVISLLIKPLKPSPFFFCRYQSAGTMPLRSGYRRNLFTLLMSRLSFSLHELQPWLPVILFAWLMIRVKCLSLVIWPSLVWSHLYKTYTPTRLIPSHTFSQAVFSPLWFSSSEAVQHGS